MIFTTPTFDDRSEIKCELCGESQDSEGRGSFLSLIGIQVKKGSGIRFFICEPCLVARLKNIPEQGK